MNQPILPPTWLMVTIALANPFAMNVFNPAMPDVMQVFNSPIDTVQLTMTLYLFTLGISQLMSGALADRFGRRPLMLSGIAVHLLGCLLAAMAPDIVTLITGRVLQALGGGTLLVLVRTMILDTQSRDEAGQHLGYINMSIAVAQMLAPTIGGYLNYYLDWRAIFYFSLLLNTTIALLMFYQLQETSAPPPNVRLHLPTLIRRFAEVLKSPIYLGYALTGALMTSAYLAFASIMPYIFAHHFNGTSAEYGNWFLLVSLGFFSGSLLASRITVRFGIDKMIQSGLLLALTAALILLATVLTQQVAILMIFLPMGVITFGRGLLQSSTQAGAISNLAGSRGTASGMMGFMQLMIATAVTQSMPLLLNAGVIYVFIAILLLLMLAAMMYYIAIR